MTEPGIDAAAMEFKDRTTGLILFGVVGILIGAFKLMSFAVMLLVVGVAGGAEDAPGPEFASRAAPLSLGYQAAEAIAWIWLGIGSIRIRRWARALLLIYSWFWLLTGATGLVAIIVLLPRMMQRMPSTTTSEPAITAAVMAVMSVLMGLFMVVLPAIFILFYGSRHVKATCEWRDPTPRWTDRCPLPVLAMSLWYLFGAVAMPTGPALLGVFPLFGVFLEGVPAIAAVFAMMGLWAWQAWGLYRLDRMAWRISLATTIVFGLSAIATFARSDLLDLYSRMNLSEQQLDMMRSTGLLEGQALTALIAASIAVWVGGLFWIRRYFSDPVA